MGKPNFRNNTKTKSADAVSDQTAMQASDSSSSVSQQNSSTSQGFNLYSLIQPEIQETDATVTFDSPIGQPLSWLDKLRTYNVNSVTEPGVVAFNILHMPGLTHSAISPAIKQDWNIFKQIRPKNVNAVTYNEANVACFLMATAELLAMMSYARVLYSITKAGDQRLNWYVPEAFAAAHHLIIDTDECVKFRTGYNKLVESINNALQIPASTVMYDAFNVSFGKFYAEANTTRTQIYTTVPAGFWRYIPVEERTEQQYEENEVLRFARWTNQQHTLTDVLTVLSEAYQDLANTTEFNNMLIDMRRVYTKSIAIDFLSDEGDPIQVVVNHDILEQFKNATPIGRIDDSETIKDETFKLLSSKQRHYLSYQPYINIETAIHPASEESEDMPEAAERQFAIQVTTDLFDTAALPITTESDNVSNEQVYNLTSYMTIPKQVMDGSTSRIMLKTFGLLLMEDFVIIAAPARRHQEWLTFNFTSNYIMPARVVCIPDDQYTVSKHFANLAIYIAPMLSAFKYLPRVHFCTIECIDPEDHIDEKRVSYPFWQTDHIGTLSQDSLSLIQDNKFWGIMRPIMVD